MPPVHLDFSGGREALELEYQTVSSVTDPLAAKAMAQLKKLRGCQFHSTVILSEVDEQTFKRLGVQVTCEPRFKN